MATRATNIKVNVDVNSAIAKSKELARNMQAVGNSGHRAGTQIQQGMNQAKMGLNQASDAAAASAVRFQTATQGMINLSTAGVQTFTSISNLARAQNRAAASQVSYDRAVDLVNRKQFKLNELIAQGNANTSKATLLRNELATATEDLAVKEEKLKIEQEAVLDVQLLFAANLVNVGVSSVQIFTQMLGAETTAMIKSKLATIAKTIATKINTLANWNNTRSLAGNQIAMKTSIGTTIMMSKATKAATIATNLFKAALGPVGLIMIGIGAAYAAYETNLFGMKDAINQLLGIQQEENEVVEEGTELMNLQADAVEGLGKQYEKLSRPMQTYVDMMIRAAKETNNATLLLQAYQIQSQKSPGFNSGGITTQGTGGTGTGGTGTGGTGSSGTGRGSGNRSGKPDPKLQTDSGLTPQQEEANPFGGLEARARFWALQPYEQADLLAVLLLENEGNPGIQQEIQNLYYDINLATNGFQKRPEHKSLDALDLYDPRNIDTKNESGFGLPIDPHDGINLIKRQNVGFGSLYGIGDINKMSNRELVRKAYGMDIGEVANSISKTEALRIGALEKEMRKFNAHGKTFLTGVGDPSLKNFATTSISQSFGVFSPQAMAIRASMAARKERFLARSIGGRAAEALAAVGYNATQAYQVGTVKVPAWVKAQQDRKDAFANSRSMGYLLGLQGILGRSGGRGLGRSAADALRKDPIGGIGLGGFAISQFFGTEEELIERLREKMRDFDMSDIDAPSKIQQIYNQTVEDARKTAERIPSIPAQIGIDFAIGEYERGVIGRRSSTTIRGTSRLTRSYSVYGQVLKRFFSIEEINQRIKEDIQASSNIAIPTGRKLLEVTEAFNANGRFSNFNNVGITQDAMTGLNLTEQNVFNIRFNSTRGDRELLNRLRFQEMLQSMSSGTSSL